MAATPVPSALQANLYRLFVIRLIVFACQALALAYAFFVQEMRLSYTLILGIVVVLALLNGGLYGRLRRSTAPSQREFFAHLLTDVAGLSVLLYFTGGASNPFVSYYLVPVTIAAATLSARYTGMLSALALLCYTTLLFFFQPLEAVVPGTAIDHSMPGMDHGAATVTSAAADPIASLHTLGMWFNFLVSAVLITYFVVRMAAELRTREESIARYREDTLRNEQIIALATQAAGTAHEMGTPLGTMAVLLKDMKQENANAPELLADLELLQQQVTACRGSLRSLVRKADLDNQHTSHVPLDTFIADLRDRWRLVRPEVPCEISQQAGASPQVDVDPMLQQALINMLNNAADASPEGIDVVLQWDAQQWQMKIRDHGAGVSRDVAGQIGTRIISTKEGGMGVAHVLSQATLNRVGGRVSLYGLPEGGTLTEITLPHRFSVQHG